MQRHIDTFMRILTDDMWFKNHWMIRSKYDLQVHKRHCQWRCCFSQTALQWFEVFWGMLSPFSGLQRLLTRAPRVLSCVPRDLTGTPRDIASSPGCSPGCHQTTYVLADLSPVLPGAPEGYYIGLVNSGISPPWDYGQTTPKHSQWQQYILLM